VREREKEKERESVCVMTESYHFCLSGCTTYSDQMPVWIHYILGQNASLDK